MSKLLSEMSLEELWELFPIILQEHNPVYKEWYSAERDTLINVADRKNVKRISHIGSTAVEGLIAKPTVDILLELNPDCDVEQLKSRLIEAGWLCMSFKDAPDLNMVFNKGYTAQGFSQKVYHLHVRFFGDWNELYFRDYLLENKVVADEYGKLKISLQKKYEHNRDAYTDAKSDFILKYTKLAKAEFAGRYTYPS